MRYSTLRLGLFLLAGLLFAAIASFAADGVKPKDATMSILPAPKTVTINGDLQEWDLSGKIGPVTFDEEVSELYHATFYAMYDKDNFYVAAVVYEQHPPYNTYPYSGRYEWCGDEVNIRMSTRPGAPTTWPRAIAEKATSPELWNGKFWWNHKKNVTKWQGYRGMDLCGKIYTENDLPGYQAAAKLDADGHGYTMEIKMPWAFLNADAPRPKPGDVIALMYEIIIGSDNKIEPVRMFQIFGNCPGNGTAAFIDYNVWGTAIFK
ncbi:MAG TPA: hypothetical protein VGL77_18005 [Armatimonadota bacterium]|jgi:hypothetical protein